MSRISGSLLILTWVGAIHHGSVAGDEARASDHHVAQLAAAQRAEQEAGVTAAAQQIIQALGSNAGVPETSGPFASVPASVPPLEIQEIIKGFEAYERAIERGRWWSIGEDPTQSNHKLREVASIVAGCCAAIRAGCIHPDALQRTATEAGDYLLWTQQQAGTGGFPFPARRGGPGKVFGIVDRALARAEQNGTYDQVVKNGWIIDDADLNAGGLQFDNGECGMAMLDLYEATGEQRFLDSARSAAGWAMRQPCVPNWNYNAFSVSLLAEVYRATGEQRYLESAKQKARLGMLPGQLVDGPHAGRWVDPHNAVISYHYILLRGLILLTAVLDESDPDRDRVVSALRSGLQAGNGQIIDQGISFVDEPLNTLLLLEKRLPEHTQIVGDCQQDQALDALTRYVIARARGRQLPCGASVWGSLLEHSAAKLGE